MTGETLSHFRILERVGRGGMGEVWKAEDTRLRRVVALKMLPAECAATDSGYARLLAEARAASALVHPNIAVVYEVGDVESEGARRSFIAMEYVPGETLADRVARGKLPPEEAVGVLKQIADALAAAHERGVLHRDVKPGNVVFAADGRVKVLDFGLAKRLPAASATWGLDEATRTAAGEVVGTVSYMSPEQSLGRTLDERSDVFSLGVVAYELLAGHRPFEGASTQEVLDAIRFEDPEDLAGVPPALGALVGRMLAKDPARRPASMREVRAALEGAASAALPAAHAGPAGVAVLPFANITRSPEDDWLGTGIAESVTADLERLPGVCVVSRERLAEAAARRGGAIDDEGAVPLGRAVGARWAVTGGYQRAAETLRVTARVLDVASGSMTGTVKIDGKVDGIFALQDRLVAEISTLLDLPARPREAEETPVVAAYEAYTKGLVNLRTESRESLDRAILFFQRAIALDPNYARAHQALGTAWDLKASFLVVPELFERALAEYRRALELRPDFVFAWKELAGSLLSLGRDDEALEAVGRALRLDPNDPGGHGMHGRILFIGMGRFREAAEEYERAVTLNPEAGWYALQLSHVCALLRDFPRGEAAARRAVELQEEFLSGRGGLLSVGAYMRLGQMAALQGRFAEAVEWYRREEAFLDRVDHALQDRTRVELAARIGSALVRGGEAEAGRAALQAAVAAFDERVALGADEPFSRYYAAGALAMLGEKERALDALERCAGKRRAFTVERAKIEPDFEGLRDDPRFLALLG